MAGTQGKYDSDFVKELEELLSREVNEQDEAEQERRRQELRNKRRRLARKKRTRKCILLVCILFGVLVTAAGLVFLLYEDSLAYSVCRVEAGVPVVPNDFLKKPDDTAYFTDNSEPIDIYVPGEYNVEIKTGWFTVSSVLYVEDTKAPLLEVRSLYRTYGETCVADEFLVKVEDITETSVTFQTEPDFTRSGRQEIILIARDLGGNETIQTAELWLSPIVTPVFVEMGEEMPDVSALVVAGVDAEYVTDISLINCGEEGEHTVRIRVAEEDYEVQVIVQDTTGPVLNVQEVMDYAIIEKKPEDFVTFCEDLSGVEISFKQVPDFSYVGEQVVTIVAVDGCGNVTEKETMLIQVADEDAPVFLEGEDFLVYIGETVAYKSKVSVVDNCEIGFELTVDASAVDLKTEGVYPVVYTATDAAGNTTVKTLNVTVKVYRADEVELNAKIDAIFEQIFTEDMTNRERCKAIYDYIRANVSYISYSEKGDVIKAAMEGLTKGKGDCYVYFSLSKVMLTRAGFPNMDIERIRVGDSMHFWNLVDIGDGHGWYHFDATPRVGRPYIFLWDDATIWEYSDSHDGSHNYDKSLYPEIN